ncbi:MAG: TatD family hydrolase [Parcubacteria group bacterium]|nr:TatD family hydrolase [Parcubacteria group bacterium]
MPDFIDAHAHVNFAAFDKDRDETIKRALDNNTWIINVGTQQDTSKQAVDLAHSYEKGVYAIVGTHPVHTNKSYHDKDELGEGGAEFTSRGEAFDKDFYRQLLKDPKVVGLGECGLDYYHLDEGSREKQKKVFVEHIELANEVGKPLMLHIRNSQNSSEPSAYAEALQILKTHAKIKGDVHFFAGNWEEAKSFLDFGFTLSFTGVITFTQDYDEVIRNTPLDMILSETDCPYVSPVPFRGKRNEPVYVSEVVKKIAEIKGENIEKVKKTIVSNIIRVFGLK